MKYTLSHVVPWGRTFEEYQEMFCLTQEDLTKNIISFGDGPASFNAELAKQGKKIVSIDPVYQFTKAEIEKRIEETAVEVLEQTKRHKDNFIWTKIKNIEELKKLRLNAMDVFLQDFEKGKQENHYIPHSLPEKTSFKEKTFDIGLSSHFLLLYDSLGVDFHIAAITEMLRVCKEIRIFPTVNLDAKKGSLFYTLLTSFEEKYHISIKKSNYQFQKNGDEMLVIKSKTD